MLFLSFVIQLPYPPYLKARAKVNDSQNTLTCPFYTFANTPDCIFLMFLTQIKSILLHKGACSMQRI